jgi:hypothetical protein
MSSAYRVRCTDRQDIPMIYQQVELFNVEGLLIDPQNHAIGFTRVPDGLRLLLNDNARAYALHTAGCEIRFNLLSDQAVVHLQCSDALFPAIVEVYQGSFQTNWTIVGTGPTAIPVERSVTRELVRRLGTSGVFPYDPELTRILLPWNASTQLVGLDGQVSVPRPEQSPLRKYLAYGSSITHGAIGIRPSDTYGHWVARAFGADLINLGLAGGAHLEPAMAAYIANRSDWDFATLEMGINVIGDIEVGEFEEPVRTFVATIARRHPEQWIACIDLFTCDLDIAKDPKIAAFRTVVRAVVEQLNLPRLIHISGTELLTSVQGLTADLVHPSTAGMEEIAHNLVHVLHNHIASAE